MIKRRVLFISILFFSVHMWANNQQPFLWKPNTDIVTMIETQHDENDSLNQKRVFGALLSGLVGFFVMNVLNAQKSAEEIRQEQKRELARSQWREIPDELSDQHIAYLSRTVPQKNAECGIYALIVVELLFFVLKKHNYVLTPEALEQVHNLVADATKMKKTIVEKRKKIGKDNWIEAALDDDMTNMKGFGAHTLIVNHEYLDELFLAQKSIFQVPASMSFGGVTGSSYDVDCEKSDKRYTCLAKRILLLREKGVPFFIIVNKDRGYHWYLLAGVKDEKDEVRVVVMDSLSPLRASVNYRHPALVLYNLIHKKCDEQFCKYISRTLSSDEHALAVAKIIDMVFYQVQSQDQVVSDFNVLIQFFIDDFNRFFKDSPETTLGLALPSLEEGYNDFGHYNVDGVEKIDFSYSKDDGFFTFFSRIFEDERVKVYVEQRIEQEKIGISFNEFKQRFQELFGENHE